MSDFMADLSQLVNVNGRNTADTVLKNGGAGKSKLEMDDYLQLMVAMFKNQSMDDTADIGDMMNNMVQMSVVEAITSVTSLIEQSTALNYAAGLVGKEVTVGENLNGQIIEHFGTVTGTGTYNGQQVIFMGEDCYYVSAIMAVGRLPQNREAIGGVDEAEQQAGLPATPAAPASGTEDGGEGTPPAEAAAEAEPQPVQDVDPELLAEQGSDAAAEETVG